MSKQRMKREKISIEEAQRILNEARAKDMGREEFGRTYGHLVDSYHVTGWMMGDNSIEAHARGNAVWAMCAKNNKSIRDVLDDLKDREDAESHTLAEAIEKGIADYLANVSEDW